ncbi:MAG TPA: glucosaminidase domain-containing protein [Candidatus Onthousia faecipullorum]|uniref:Glucosaminidase domain-containing protein n=1 Tax=Candidatus Onthousia faecipullorum TaxID=2840887 RepID=A0A9D1GA73_9FIRM|nr:glucosaminidase domain-containing protein [Candidatus Onthousia faecipullorum]
MKKVSKLSLTLASLGVFMIGLAGVLQYKAFEIEGNTVAYETVTMNDLSTGRVEEVKNQNKNETSIDTVDESNDNIVEDATTEEVVIEDELEDVKTYEEVSTVPVDPIVYDGLTMGQLADKLNRSLKSTISGKGYLIASYSLQLGIDPYMATAIILHETGCNGTCSRLVRECNNVGGQKGGPSCGGGSYKAYTTLDEGIMGYLDNLYRNYYSYGLTTPETIGPKYAASTTWASQVNNYIALIKSR